MVKRQNFLPTGKNQKQLIHIDRNRTKFTSKTANLQTSDDQKTFTAINHIFTRLLANEFKLNLFTTATLTANYSKINEWLLQVGCTALQYEIHH